MEFLARKEPSLLFNLFKAFDFEFEGNPNSDFFYLRKEQFSLIRAIHLLIYHLMLWSSQKESGGQTL